MILIWFSLAIARHHHKSIHRYFHVYIPGHLSVGYLLASAYARHHNRYPGLYPDIFPFLLGSLTPDLIDKPLFYLSIADHSRTVAHSSILLAIFVIIWLIIRRRQPTVGRWSGCWIAGIFAHHLTDFVSDFTRGVLHGGQLLGTWFLWPWMAADHWRFTPPLAYFPQYRLDLLLEISVVAFAIYVAWRIHIRPRS